MREGEPLPSETIEPKKAPEANLDRLKEIVKRGNFVIVTDLDGTVVPYRLNPKECEIDPDCHQALLGIAEQGIPIASITGRSAAEGGKLLEVPEATIIGTFGWETWQSGKSYIRKELHPYLPEITRLLEEIRRQFFEATIGGDIKDKIGTELTAEIPTEQGLIVFERKGVAEEAPDGISHTYNFNQYENCEDAKKRLDDLYKQLAPPDLRDIFEVQVVERGVNFVPRGGKGKEYALIDLLRQLRKEGKGFDVLYLGDSDNDARALRVVHLLTLLTQRKGAGVLVLRPSEFGLINPSQKEAATQASIHVLEIEGNAKLLKFIADTLEENREERK